MDVSGIDAVQIEFRLLLRSRPAGPAPLTSLAVLTVMASLASAATAFAALVRRAETIAGTHDELLAAGGRDADLHRIQAAAHATT